MKRIVFYSVNITKIVVGIYLVMFTSTITAQTSSRTIKEGNRTIVEETNRGRNQKK